MIDSDYWGKRIRLRVNDSCDTIGVEKNSGTDWAEIYSECNGVRHEITLRSREAAEGLKFIVEQLLRGS